MGLLESRLTSQLLAGTPAMDPVAVAERLLAVQGQDPRGFRLAVRARTEGLAASDVERALTEDRTLVVTWLNRGTLHLVRSEDYPWLQRLTTGPQEKAIVRRLGQLGVEPRLADRGVAAIERTITASGPLTRDGLVEPLERVGIPPKGQALPHVIGLAATRGLIVRGPVAGAKQAYVLVRDWLGEPGPVDRDKALAELARRFLAGHGPADERDLAKWAGLPLRDVRAGLGAIASQLDERDDGLLDLTRRDEPADLPPPRLLGPFDPVLLGWVNRDFLLGKHAKRITVGGLFNPFALVRGQAVGVWKLPQGRVELEPFGRLRRAEREALEADAAEVKSFLSR